MTSYINEIIGLIKKKIYHKYFLIISFVSFILAWVFSIFHYTDINYGNNFSWIFWLIAILSLLYSFSPRKISYRNTLGRIKRTDILIVVIIFIVYWVSHLWNFSTAPWNNYGLFDDAAWDIYFARENIFSGVSFQAAFFDKVGYISREVVFHYYISIFFKLFGYNLLVFNISLLVLGFLTVLFTALLIHKIFNNTVVTLISVLIINFFPLHYMHIFMGHRYAIAAPLMVVSLYYLYSSFIDKSLLKAVASALFAALCWGSAIMGKQYILGLAVSAILIVVFDKKHLQSKTNITIGIIWIIGFVISATPLLAYIVFNYDVYVAREQNLLRDFTALLREGGFPAVKPHIDQIAELFFAENSFRRQFLVDYYIIPFSYYLLIIPGMCFVLINRRFEILFLSLTPVVGAFLSGSYDFRVLLAVPIWVLTMAYMLNYVFCSKFNPRTMKGGLMVVVLVIILPGVISSILYISKVSNNPNHFYLLPHKDVAISRLIQDIVVGSNEPKSDMKPNEFNRKIIGRRIDYDTLACPYSAYAIAHLYLQEFNDKKILSFCNQGIQSLKTQEEILRNNIDAVLQYQPNRNGLKLVWEVSEKSSDIIKMFSKYNMFGEDETLSDTIDGKSFSVYILKIKSKNVKRFQEEVAGELFAQVSSAN